MMNSAVGITLLMCCTLTCAFELLSAPENVTLACEDLHCILTWATPHNSGTVEYEIEIIDWGYGDGPKYKNWTRVNKTCDILGPCWKCDLSSYLNDIYLSYQARVRAVREGYTSNWTSSNKLQLLRDVTLGPPEIMLLIHNQKLEVTVATRISPHQNENGSFKRVHNVLTNLKYHISIYEERREVDQNKAVLRGEKIQYISNRTLKTNTLYCALVTITFDQRSANATQCIITPAEPSGFLLIGLGLACPALLVCILGLCCIVKHVHPDCSKTPLPSVLQAFMNEDLGLYQSNKMSLNAEKVDSILMCPRQKLSCKDDFDPEMEIACTQHMIGEYDFSHDTGFQSKGFGQNNYDTKAYLGTNLSLLSTNIGLSDGGSEDGASSAAGLLEEDFRDSSASEFHSPVHHQIHSNLPLSMSERSGGHFVCSKGQQAMTPLLTGNVGADRYQDSEETLQHKLNIPFHSVMLQICVEPLDLQTLHEFYDTTSDESAEEKSLDSQSVGSSHDGMPHHNHNITSFSGEGSNCGYESRPIIIHIEMEGPSVYQLRDDATDTVPEENHELQ